MNFNKGSLSSINSYGMSMAYLLGNWMTMMSFTDIKPHPKLGTYGFNVGGIILLLKDGEGGFNTNMLSSAVVFWTKPYKYNKKIVLSPQIFIMGSPVTYIPMNKSVIYNKQVGFLVGSSFDYKISKRFGLSLNYKANINTAPGSRLLHNFLIGSRMVL
jgi:hypothetical protein